MVPLENPHLANGLAYLQSKENEAVRDRITISPIFFFNLIYKDGTQGVLANYFHDYKMIDYKLKAILALVLSNYGTRICGNCGTDALSTFQHYGLPRSNGLTGGYLWGVPNPGSRLLFSRECTSVVRYIG